MKQFIFLIISIIFVSFISCETENVESNKNAVVLQLRSDKGKDAIIRYYITPDTNNYGNHPLLNIHAWTNSGIPVIHRSLIDFDLSEIPSKKTIESAYLFLYAVDPYIEIGDAWAQGCFYGDNECYIRRITSEWDENTVNWENQPSVSTENEILISKDTSECNDYILNITQLINDYLDNPNSSYGFIIQLKTEEYYSRRTYASSDFKDSLRWPKLEIRYFE